MKKIAFFLASAAAIAAVPAQARDGQPYIGVNGGVSLEDQVDIDFANTDPQTNAAFADTELGIDADVVVGYDFGAFRLEAEGGYKSAGFDSVTIVNRALLPTGSTVPVGAAVASDGDLRILSGMLNGLLEFGSDDGVQIFAGGGIGFANVDLPVAAAGAGTLIDSDNTDLAWQLLAGARVAVTDKIDLGVKYRYFTVDDFQLQSASNTALEAGYATHSILASLTYNFGRKAEPEPVMEKAAPEPVAPPPPPPVVAPPPPPRPACNTGPYIVFFDFDRSDITAEAASILNNAVTAYANCGNARVMLAGHTDTSGRATYNEALAERRNASVRSYMTGRGVAAGQITGEAFGESQPRVPTADGVREAQNRRVEVTYGPGSGR